MFWEDIYASSSYSRSYNHSDVEDYIDSDDDMPPAPKSRQPNKPVKQTKSLGQKPAKSVGHKQAKSLGQKSSNGREKFTEKVELWFCKICDKKFTTKSGLNRHFTTVHGIKKDVKETKKKPKAENTMTPCAPSPRFRCSICRKELATQQSLDRHVNTIHNKVAKPKPRKVSNTTNVNVNVYNSVTYNHYDRQERFVDEDSYWNI